MFRQTSNNPHGFWKLFLLLIMVGTAALGSSPVSADTGVTIAAQGDRSYYLGEKVVFSGHNYDSDTTYLFTEGPGTFVTGPGIPGNGGKLTSPRQTVVSGNPDSFTIVKTKPDKTWEYTWYTTNLKLDAGTYNVHAMSQPKAMDQAGPAAAGVGIIVKKPFITAEIAPATVSKGVPFTVSGVAEGIPPYVQIWIIGDNYVFNTTTPVNPDASFTFKGDTQRSGKLPKGQCYLIVQHPMADNQSDFVISGDYVRSLKLNNGTNVFRLTGPGSLQGSDAADALIAAISDQEANDHTYTSDLYTLVPFQVTDSVSGASADAGVTISADGDKSYYQGENVILRGQSPDADTVYLFMTGPNIPATGGKLTSPYTTVVSGNPDSFTLVKTKPDKTWEYTWYTANLQLGAGTYSVYAANQPKTENPPGPEAARVGIALKQPFISANISSSEIVKGQPFTVTGVAEGIPPEVQVWMIGDNYTYTTKTPVNSTDASFAFNADAALSGKLPAGKNYLIVEHPMADNQFDVVVSGDYVRSQKPNNGTNVFRLTGPGSLQGSDAADALVAAINDQEADDKMLTSDTYTLIPFQVTDTGNPTSQTVIPPTTATVRRTTQSGLFGAIEETFRSFLKG